MLCLHFFSIIFVLDCQTGMVLKNIFISNSSNSSVKFKFHISPKNPYFLPEISPQILLNMASNIFTLLVIRHLLSPFT